MSAPGGSSSSSSSRSIPFKSKKRLMDSPCSKSQPANSNPSPKSMPTPDNMFTRSRNRSVALSVKEIRQAAGSRPRSEDPLVKVSSAKTKLVFSQNDSSSSSSSPSKRTKNAKKEELPEKYEILGEFFDKLDSSIVLSKLKGLKPTFFNISAKIELLTERRFCYNHLAQLKHILPEAIEIKRVLIYDERTSCMKPDLHITLNADAVEYNEISKSESKKLALRKIFRARLADFVKAHPQGDEVPEEPLPLCNKRKPNDNSTVQVISGSSLMEEMASIPAVKLISPVIQVPSSPVKTASSPASTPCKTTSTPAKPTFSEMNIASTPVKQVSTLASVPSTPVNNECKPVIVASTPPEFASTPVRMFSTASRLQKRGSSYTNPDDVSTANPPVKLARRSMNFDSYTEDEKAIDVADDEAIDQLPEENVLSDDEILSILPDKLRQSIIEQERKAIEDSNPAISQAKRRLKMITRLPKLFNVMHYLIQSIRRWVITKEEFVHKIICGHSDFTDRKEVEEQLILMQELVPEWISEKRSSCGDLLVCINKLASPQTIRSRLEEENKKAIATPLS